MVGRYAIASGGAAFVTAALVVLMYSLIVMGPARLEKVAAGRVIEFVRLRHDTETKVKDRKLPERSSAEEPPPPDVSMADMPAPDLASPTGMAPSVFQPQLDLAGGPALAAAPADADVVPLVRVSPQYPPDAMMRGVEGWVHVRFTITSAGTVRDVQVVDADPKGTFDRAATNAVKRYKYKPKVENGEAVDRPGVELVISFRLQK